MEYLYVKQIVQQFADNAYRKNIVVRAKCLLIYYTNVFKLFYDIILFNSFEYLSICDLMVTFS